mmetsp:Transcript_25740/g.78242  ORF Transcript_25740/g.78242 Transcript_25740/m.78242 type:complete len:81 (+) Transcript_25740:1085-1327(+)|eukprot:scaffold276810_cov35-Tisochrysis_lutea.AAC.3
MSRSHRSISLAPTGADWSPGMMAELWRRTPLLFLTLYIPFACTLYQVVHTPEYTSCGVFHKSLRNFLFAMACGCDEWVRC